MQEIANPYTQMLISLPQSMFFGRKPEIKAILHGISAKEPSSFAIHGIKTIGKTSLLKYLRESRGGHPDYRDSLIEYGPGLERELLFFYADFYGIEGAQVVPVLLEKARRWLISTPGLENVWTTGETPSPSKANDNLIELVRRLKDREIRLVFCLDDFDKAFQSMTFEDDIFIRGLTDYQPFVIVTEKPLKELRDDFRWTSPFLNVLNVRDLGLLSEKDAKDLVETPALEAGDPFTPDEATFLLETGGRQPYLLTLICEYLFKARLEYPEIRERLLMNEGMQQRIRSQMGSLHQVTDLFDIFWDRMNDKERKVIMRIAKDKIGDMALEDYLPGIRELEQKSLLYNDNLMEEKYQIFSELFCGFVLNKLSHADIREVVDHLAPLDRRLFEHLLKHPEQVCTIDELLSEYWGDRTPEEARRGLEAAVSRLRTAIKKEDRSGWEYIRNVRSKGYRYVPKA